MESTNQGNDPVNNTVTSPRQTLRIGLAIAALIVGVLFFLICTYIALHRDNLKNNSIDVTIGYGCTFIIICVAISLVVQSDTILLEFLFDQLGINANPRLILPQQDDPTLTDLQHYINICCQIIILGITLYIITKSILSQQVGFAYALN